VETGGRPVVAVLAVLAMLTGGCAAAPSGGHDATFRVVASMTVVADFVEQVGAEHVEVASLVPAGADPHTYEPTPADARAVADADLVVGNGAGLEPWFDRVAGASGTETVMLVDTLDTPLLDDEDGRPDPHLWMVPELAAGYVATIADVLADLDPDNAAAYHENAGTYTGRLDELDGEIRDALAAIPPERRVLVTPHDAYAYFARAYDLEVATVVGVSTEEEPSAAAVQRLVDEVRAREVPTIFFETTVNRAVIDRIAADADVEVGRPLYGDSVGEPGSGADSYVGMMRANVEALLDGLADG
jgi:ABC-type Zn uptake system ZnuABC Zn-binding protein ZnuA